MVFVVGWPQVGKKAQLRRNDNSLSTMVATVVKRKESSIHQDLSAIPAAGMLRRVGGAFAVGLSVLTTLAPLFGPKGIRSLIPLPGRLSNIGRPLITVLSLAVVLILGILLWPAKPARWKTIFGLAMLVVALVLLGNYMSWIAPNGTVFPPSLQPFDPDVVAIFVVAVAVALLAGSLVTLGSQWIINPSWTPDAILHQTNQLDALKPSQTDSVGDLCSLVQTANWTGIERKSRGLRSSYWRLFGAMSRLLVNPRQETADLRAARRLLRTLAVTEAFRFGKDREPRRRLLAVAEALLPWLTSRNEAWRELDTVDLPAKKPVDAFNAYVIRFALSYKTVVDLIGYAKVIDDSGKALGELLAFKRSTPFVNLGSAVAQQCVEELFKKGLDKAVAELDRSTLMAIASDDRAALALAGYDAARECLHLRSMYPVATVAWRMASYWASSAYCLAIAADEREDSLSKLEALAYAVDESCERLHVDVAALGERMVSVRQAIYEREQGVKVSAELEERIEMAARKVDGLLRSRGMSSA